MQLILVLEPIDELNDEVALVDRTADGGQVVSETLQLTGVVGNGEVTVWSVEESFAEEEIPRGLIVEEESREASPGGARQAVSAGDEAIKVVAKRAMNHSEMWISTAC
jgi:hypothetical protein